MRALLSSPDGFLDPATYAPRFGSYRGGLPRVDLRPIAPRLLDRLLKEKRWVYLAIVSSEVYIAVAVVRFGYLANAFTFVFDRANRRMLVDRSAIGPPFSATVSDLGWNGGHARARLPGIGVRIERSSASSEMLVDVSARGVEIQARIDIPPVPPAIAAIAPIPGGIVNATEKRLLLPVRGRASVSGRIFSLDGAFAGYDFTHGLLARRTRWRWALALGRAKTGERIGMNLVEGFVGEPECALWIDDELFPLAEGRFSFDASRPLDPWRVGTADGALELVFTPAAHHAERTDLGVVASRFTQPVGVYAGTIRAPFGRVLELDGVLGVTEDQDMLW